MWNKRQRREKQKDAAERFSKRFFPAQSFFAGMKPAVTLQGKT